MFTRILNERIAHMHGVAEYMHDNADKYDLDSERMYVLGLLHDIGYLYGANEHESNGASLLESIGVSDDIVEAVKHHGDALIEGEEYSPELLLLIEADMHVDLSGHDVGYDARLEDIANRHGNDSVAFLRSRDNIEFLRARVR